MTRSELIQQVHRCNPGITTAQAEERVKLMFDRIMRTLSSDARIELQGLEGFTPQYPMTHTEHNPSTGDAIKVAGKAANVPVAKASKLLRDRPN